MLPMSAALNWGILGTGNIAGQFAEGLAGAKRSRIVAVGSRSNDAAHAFVKRYGLTAECDDYERVIAHNEVDAVYIALPNHMHCRWTLDALAAGKHVLCEKPLAFNAAEAERMFDAAEKHGRLLVEAFMYRSHPQTDALLDEIRRETIGPLRMIRASFSFCTQRISDNIRFNAAMAGGALMDIGCYCIDFANLCAGVEPIAVAATGRRHESGVDDLAAGSMTYPNGIVASFTCGMAAQTDNTTYLCGTKGFIAIPVPWKPSAGGRYVVDSMSPPRLERDRQNDFAARREQTQSHDRPLYALEADHFAESVLDGKAPAISRRESLANMRILDAMRRQIGVPITPQAATEFAS